MIEPVLQGRPDDAVDLRRELRIVQTVFRLTLELRLLYEDAQDARHPFADVFRHQRHALRREVVRLDEVADRFADAGPQSAFVRAAGSGGNAVDIRANVFLGRFGPLQDEIDPGIFLPDEHERRVVHRLRVPLGDNLFQILDDAFVVLEDQLLF